MRIGVLGYYGYGNAGDEVLLRSLRAFLAPHHVTPIPIGFAASASGIARLNRFDFLVFGAGGLIQRGPVAPFSTFDQWADKLTTPLGVLGLGVERPGGSYALAIQRLVEQSVFFIVRDRGSKEIVGHPKVRLAPDLSFYEPMRTRRNSLQGTEPVCGINLRTTHRGDVARWIASIRGLPCGKRGIVLSSHPDYGEWPVLSQLDPTCPESFSASAYADIDFMIGTAFHSIVFAIQAGLPVVAVNYNPKVQRLMHDLDLAEFLIEWDEPERLATAYCAMLERRVELQVRMTAYTLTATAELQKLRHDVLPAIEQAAQTRPFPASLLTRPKLVSLLVHCDNAAADALKQTISSCLCQTFRNIEVICCASSGRTDVSSDGRLVFLTTESEDKQPLRSALGVSRGDYVTVIHAGHWFAEDAVATMVAAMADAPKMDAVCSDYFLTHGGIIERRVVTAGEHVRRWGGCGSLCYLLRRDVAAKWIADHESPGNGSFPRVTPNPPRIGHLPCALLYAESTETELLIYRSVIAFRLGQLERGRALMSAALEAEPSLAREQLADLAGLLDEASGKIGSVSDRRDFLHTFFCNLPDHARSLAVLRKPLRSRVAMAEFFSAYRRRAWEDALTWAREGIRDDPGWLRNRGVWRAIFVAAWSRLTRSPESDFANVS